MLAQSSPGGGILSCLADKDGLAEGEDCAFLYPGLHVALVGRWAQGRMAEAKPGKYFSQILNCFLMFTLVLFSTNLSDFVYISHQHQATWLV